MGVMPLTLWWAYQYYALFGKEQTPKGCETVECALELSLSLNAKLKDLEAMNGMALSRGLSAMSANSDDEAVPPMERTTTPFLMDSSRTMGSHASKDAWDRFNFEHHREDEAMNGIDIGHTEMELRTSTMDSTAV